MAESRSIMKTMKKLNNHASANAHVEIINANDRYNNEISLVSYTTRVLTLTTINGIRYVECTGLYSMTTRKHISWFLREYAPDLNYTDIRDMKFNEAYCLETGELLPNNTVA